MYLSFFRLFCHWDFYIWWQHIVSPYHFSENHPGQRNRPSPVYLLHVQQWQIWIRERRKQWLANVPQGWSWGKGSGHREIGWQVTLEGEKTCSGHTDRRTHRAAEKSLPPGEKQGTLKNLVLSFILSQCHSLFPPRCVSLWWGGACAYELDCGCPQIPEYLFLKGLNPMELELEVVISQLPAIGAGNWTQICWEKKKKNYKCF